MRNKTVDQSNVNFHLIPKLISTTGSRSAPSQSLSHDYLNANWYHFRTHQRKWELHVDPLESLGKHRRCLTLGVGWTASYPVRVVIVVIIFLNCCENLWFRPTFAGFLCDNCCQLKQMRFCNCCKVQSDLS